jgi:hypothetical protein
MSANPFNDRYQPVTGYDRPYYAKIVIEARSVVDPSYRGVMWENHLIYIPEQVLLFETKEEYDAYERDGTLPAPYQEWEKGPPIGSDPLA